ncbi:MAG: hypothetical protein LBL35_05565 [Clostridiales bacterium]|jgi:hypothetical protein|nr:hypothetical protein [Clostridiales bacterium]
MKIFADDSARVVEIWLSGDEALPGEIRSACAENGYYVCAYRCGELSPRVALAKLLIRAIS